MDIPYFSEMPILVEILLIILGLFFLIEGLSFLSKKEGFVPIITVKKEKNPFAYWIVVSYWLIFGLFLLILVLFSLLEKM